VVAASLLSVASVSSLLRRAGRASGPDQGLQAIADLRRELDALERHHVAAALEQGWSWSRVAEALGVSKQAAHKRHARAVRELRQRREAVRESRVVVAPAAREAVQFAHAEARATGSKVVGTEHLLIGVLSAASAEDLGVLEAHGVDVDSARGCLQPTLPQEDRAIADAHAPTAAAAAESGVSPLARTCLEHALRETVRRGDPELDARHLLLALVSRPEGGAARTLHTLGTSPEAIRQLLETRPA
jgi:ATP-dependent Clp protease ATP-binding subunit ClpA